MREIHLMTIQMPIDPSRKDVHCCGSALCRIVLLTPQYRSTYAVVAAAEGMPFASAPSVSCFLALRQQQPRAPLTGQSPVLLGAVSATAAQREATAKLALLVRERDDGTSSSLASNPADPLLAIAAIDSEREIFGIFSTVDCTSVRCFASSMRRRIASSLLAIPFALERCLAVRSSLSLYNDSFRGV